MVDFPLSTCPRVTRFRCYFFDVFSIKDIFYFYYSFTNMHKVIVVAVELYSTAESNLSYL
jgi:hypothetical protein